MAAYNYAALIDGSIDRVIIAENTISSYKYLSLIKKLGYEVEITEFVQITGSPLLKKIKIILAFILLCKGQTVIIGSDNNIYFKIFILLCSNCVIVDDGTEVLHSKLTQSKFGITKTILFKILNFINPPTHSSIMSDKNLSLPKLQNISTVITPQRLLLILSPITEEGILSYPDYGDLLRACGQRFKSEFAIDTVIIVPHPRSHPEAVEFAKLILEGVCECEIWLPKATIELSLDELEQVPQHICSFESTASLILELLYPHEFKHFVYQLPQSRIKSYERERFVISQYFSQRFRGTILNE